MDFFNSPKRFVPGIRSRRMSTFHLSLISVSVVSTGQAGSSFAAAAICRSLLYTDHFKSSDIIHILWYLQSDCQAPMGRR